MAFLEHKYGYVKDGKVFLKAYREFEDREIGEVRESDEKSLQYFLDKFELAENKVKELIRSVKSATNKGSYLMKLLHLKEYLTQYKAIGDFNALMSELEEVEEDLNKVISGNREKNLSQKKEIVEKAESMKDSMDWKVTTEKFKELQRRWVKIGRAKDDEENEVAARFKEIVDYFFNRRNQYYETKKLVFEDRLNQYREIINKASDLSKSSDLEKASKSFNQLHDDWKKVGNVQRDKLIELWKEFKAYSDEFYKRYNSLKKQPVPRNDIKANLAQKEALLKEAQSLLSMDLDNAIEKAKFLQKEFKSVGPTPQEEARDISEQFWLTCDYIFETNYLFRVLNKKYPNFTEKEDVEQHKLKKDTLKELIRRDQDELQLFEENAEKFSGNGRNRLNNVIDSRFRNQKRKLTAKKMILERVEMERSN